MVPIHLKSLDTMKMNKCKTCGQHLPVKHVSDQGDFTKFMDKTIKRVFRIMDEEFGINVKKSSKSKNKRPRNLDA